jgi:hypothetical protein
VSAKVPDPGRREWLRLEARSLEALVRFVFWTLARLAFLVLAFRYALGADVTHLPWRFAGLR